MSASLFPGKFELCTDKIESIALPNLAPPQRIDDCVEIHLLHSEPCDLQLSNHQNVHLLARLYQCVFCKKPLLFRFSSRCRNFGPSGSEKKYSPFWLPLSLDVPNLNLEKCLCVLALLCLRDYQ